jgi:outer membrane receptor for ferric coprogen and ferric-rhodotorulic acid
MARRHHPSTSGAAHPVRTKTALAVQSALLIGIFAGVITLPESSAYAQTASRTAQQQYNIGAGSLGGVLNNFASAAGIELSVDAALTQNKVSQGLRGSYTVAEGFAALLQGQDLQVVRSTNGAYSLRLQESSDDIKTLPDVVVKAVGVGDPTEGTGSYTALAPISTAAKLGLTLRETPQSVTVMTRQRLDDQNLTNLDAALAQAPGVTITTAGAYADRSSGARGYALTHQRDGMSIGAADSYTLLPSDDLEMYDRVEIVRGPTGLLEGSGDSFGGVVNLVRKRPQAELGGSASVTIGSWNNVRTSASLTGSLNKDKTVRGRAVIVNQDREFFYDTAKASNSTAYGIVEFDLSPKTLLTLSASYSRAKSMPFYGLPANGGGFARSTYVGAAWNKVEVNGKFDTMAEVTHQLDNDWKLKLVAIHQSGDSEGQFAMASGLKLTSGSAGRVYGYRFKRDDAVTGVEATATGPFNAWGKKHELAFGVNWNEVTSDVADASSYNWMNIPLTDPGNLPLNVDDIGSLENTRTETVTTKSAIFGVARLKILDPLTVIVGGRFTNFEEKSRGKGLLNRSDWQKSEARASFEFTPYAGVVWDLSPSLSWYASYVDIFVPQTVKDWQEKTLEPRIGWQIETGIKGEFFDGRLNTSLSVFRLRDKNRAITDPDPAHRICGSNGNGNCMMAGGLQQTEGWEAEISGNVTPNWNVAASYTRSDSKILKASNAADIGKKFNTHVPRHLLKIWNTYRFGPQVFDGWLSKWHVGGGVIT